MKDKKPTSISIVIPVYNEEKTLPILIDAVKKSNTFGLKKEIVVIDDRSSDGTLEVLKKIKGIVFYTHEKNAGKGASLRTGFAKATGDIILVQDADLEYTPEDFPRILEPFFKYDADAVIGTRFRGDGARRVIYFTHEIANHALTFYSNLLTNLNLTDMECGYKAFKKEIIDQITPKLVSNRFGIEPELIARLAQIKGIILYEVGISYHGRTYEEGKKIGIMDGLKAIYEITKFNLFS
ncbi:MAG: glycosyltransferase family 2 protein [Candidatus Woesebacteria bacterium]